MLMKFFFSACKTMNYSWRQSFLRFEYLICQRLTLSIVYEKRNTLLACNFYLLLKAYYLLLTRADVAIEI